MSALILSAALKCKFFQMLTPFSNDYHSNLYFPSLYKATRKRMKEEGIALEEALSARFPEFKLQYEQTTIDPWLSCPLRDCQHFTILKLFKEHGKSFLIDDPKVVEHPYWKRLVGLRKDLDRAKNRIMAYYDLYKNLKNNGWNKGLATSKPVFLLEKNVKWGRAVVLELFHDDGAATRFSPLSPYCRYDGHHRTAIAKFLKIQLPVVIVKII